MEEHTDEQIYCGLRSRIEQMGQRPATVVLLAV